MKVAVIGNDKINDEFRTKFSNESIFSFTDSFENLKAKNYDVIFDLSIDEDLEELEKYRSSEVIVFANTIKTTLTEVKYYLGGFESSLFGINALPTFIERDIWEISCLDEDDEEVLQKVSGEIGFKYVQSDDRVGMLSARVIAMIINEAYFTVMEGTADKTSIDQAMKLGTNYPYGPFEWSEKIGIKHIYELLEALYEDSHDERYKVCPLLKKEYLKV